MVQEYQLKMLRALPSSWSQISLVIRTKPGVDNLNFDDLYNNLRAFKADVKGSTGSSLSTQNVAFVSSESANSTNDVSTAYVGFTIFGNNSQKEFPSSSSFLTNQSSCPQLDHEDLEQLNEFDLKEIDLKWQVAMISMTLKKFYNKLGRKIQFDAKEPVGFDKTKVECYNCHKTGHFARECRSKRNQDNKRKDAWNSGYKAKDNGRRPGKQEESNALITLDGEGIDWTAHAEDEEDNFALMAFSNSGSDTEVTSCSKECVESYTKLKKLYDEQREQLGDASIEIQAYTQALKKVEAQLVAYQQNQLWYEEKIRFMKVDLDDKTDVLTYHKKLLAEALKEKDELKAKFENWQNSSKNLGKLLNTQMSANDKFGLGFVTEGMHAVPPPMTRNYMPSGPDIEIDYSKFTYETLESVLELVVNEPNVVSQPKVWSDAPIIEEYESDSDDDCVFTPSKEQEQPSFAFVSTDKHVKTPRETVKNQHIHNKSPKVDRKGLGYGFTTKACFMCGSFSHLIRDCDFHEKRMAKQAELNKRVCKGDTWFYGKNSPLLTNANHVNIVGSQAVVNIANGYKGNAVKSSACWMIPHKAVKNKGLLDSGCSRHLLDLVKRPTLVDYQDYKWRRLLCIGGSKGYIHCKDSMNYQPVKLENQANKPAGPKETNHSAEIKNGDDKSKEDTSLKYKEKPVDEAEQAFLEELERHKKQEKDANDAAEALRKEVAQGTKDLLHQTRDARASGTKTISTASPSRVLGTDKSFSPVSFNYADQDDSQIPALEDIYDNPTHGIFSNASYDDEGVVTDFTNLETFVDVSPISKSRIHSIHHILSFSGVPKLAVQTRSKVEKGLAHALASYIQQQKRNNHKDF
ncbi:ribonuclease H-like domain-containing protein [Tanacetum coccineum]|uniref:Ribonuclease H-like domain-containing protein n=1 Tax=Tanacetum coccineum TaxID=301880 RepID=A0ABQ5ABD9_9ASTR